jgi:cystathionine beta-synthase
MLPLPVSTSIEALMPTFDHWMVAIVVDGERFLGLVTRIDVLNCLRRKL